jgi:hypothetical protein
LKIYLFLAAVYVLSALVPLALPAGLNLEYEYSLYLAVVLLFSLTIAAFLLNTRNIPLVEDRYRPPLAFDSLFIVFIVPLLLLIPGWLLLLLGVSSCSGGGFTFWVALQSLPNAFVAHAIFHGIILARTKQYSRRWIAVAWLSGLALLALVTIGIMYFSPQKRTVSILFGFLHGPIYDEWIPVDWGIVLSRTMHALIAGVFIILARDHLAYRRYFAATAVALLALLSGWHAAKFPSVGHGTARLESLFNKKLINKHLALHYIATDPTEPAPESVKRMFREAMFHLQDISRKLELSPSFVKIYLYPDEDSKKIWFGAGDTDVTDVRGPSVHITLRPWPHPTLRHELVHALTAQLRWLGFHPNMAITEGLAVALDPQDRDLGLDPGVAAMVYSDRLPNLNRLFGFTFWLESGPRAYTVAGSLIRYVMEHHGAKAGRSLFEGKSFAAATGEPMDVLIANWQERVLKSLPKSRAEMIARSVFRAPATLQKQCPHTRQDYQRPRSEGVLVRLRQPVGWNPEIDYFPWLLRLEPNDSAARYRFWKSEVDRVAKERQPAEGRLRTWNDVISRFRQWPPRVTEDLYFAILESDLEWALGNYDRSAEILAQVDQYGRENFIGDGLVRLVHSRQMISFQLTPEAANLWRRYLAGWAAMPLTVAVDEPWLIQYLRLRNLEYDLGIGAELKRLLDVPLPKDLNPTFYREWYRYAGLRFFFAELYRDAATAFAGAEGYSEADQREYFKMMRNQSLAFERLKAKARAKK